MTVTTCAPRRTRSVPARLGGRVCASILASLCALGSAGCGEAAGAACAGTPEQQVADVRACFERYRQALIEVDGVAATACVDNRTLEYYEAMRAAALYAPAAEVHQLPPSDKLFVLTMRYRLEADELLALDGAALFAEQVERQWIGRDSVEKNALGEVHLDPDQPGLAEARMVNYGIESPQMWRFRCEDGHWKLDLLAAVRQADTELESLVRAGDGDEDQVLLSMLETVAGEPLPADVWEPLISR